MGGLQTFLFALRDPALPRVLFATVAAPIPAMVVYAFVLTLLSMHQRGAVVPPGSATSVWEQLEWQISLVVLWGSVAAFAGLIVVGLPTYAVLKLVNAQRGVMYLLIGTSAFPAYMIARSASLPETAPELIFAVSPGFPGRRILVDAGVRLDPARLRSSVRTAVGGSRPDPDRGDRRVGGRVQDRRPRGLIGRLSSINEALPRKAGIPIVTPAPLTQPAASKGPG